MCRSFSRTIAVSRSQRRPPNGKTSAHVAPARVEIFSSGITSSRVMDDVEAAGRATEVGSNFFLFFSSRSNPTSGMDMSAMAHGHGMERATD